jgi:hypothetical protein
VAWEGHDDYEVEEAEESEDDDDNKSANSSTYGGGCRRICRMCGEECSCWNYNDKHEVVCEDCEDDDDDDNGSVCFRTIHPYDEKECSDNCPYKPGNETEEEEDDSEESLVEGVDYMVINSGIVMKEEKSDSE